MAGLRLPPETADMFLGSSALLRREIPGSQHQLSKNRSYVRVRGVCTMSSTVPRLSN